MSPRSYIHSYSSLFASSFVSYLFAILFFVSFCGGEAARSQASSNLDRVAPRRITSPIDVTSRTTIAGTTHPKVQPKLDRGPVDPTLAMDRMILVLGVSDEQEHQLRTFLDSQQTKGSPNYHHWLTPQEFGQKFGPSPEDIQQVTGWLQQQGFRVESVAKSGRWIEFSGAAAQVQTAFQTQMRSYEVNGEMHLANASDISIPSALAPVVRGVSSLHNFFSKPMHVQRGTATLKPDFTFVDSGGNLVNALTPGDFALIYNLKPLFNAGLNGTGTGLSIAIVARAQPDLLDVGWFRRIFGLPNNDPLNPPTPQDPLAPATLVFAGSGISDNAPEDVAEALLDAEWVGAGAPGAFIDVVIASSSTTTDGADLSAAFIVDNNVAPVMSMSFGACEQSLGAAHNAFLNALWQQAAAEGISAFVSAGDSGAAGCDAPTASTATHGQAVSGTASTPFNTAVGGTEFDEALGGGQAIFWNPTNTTIFVVSNPPYTEIVGSAKGYIPEMAWNESCDSVTCGANANLLSGGGGVSTIYATPSWQAASLGIPGLNFPMRALPDVSLAAAGHDGYLVCLPGDCRTLTQTFTIVRGTSASAPAFAGIMAIINQSTNSRQGLANYVLYPLAAAETFSNCNSSSRTNPATPNPAACVFNDITTGNNLVPGLTGTTFNFSAGTGYDLATGLGSVDANNLVNAFSALAAGFQGTSTTLAANPTQNPITITHGQPLNFTVNVNRAGTTGTPSGTVSLIAGVPISPLTFGPDTLVASSPLTASAPGSAAAGFTGVANLPGGTTYSLTAHYPGDGVFAASNSSALTVTVTPESSTTTFNSLVADNQGNLVSGTTASYGSTLVLSTLVHSSANVSPPDGFPTGSLIMNDGACSCMIARLPLNLLGQADINPCTSFGCLQPGSHPISVAYGGDASFSGSAAGPIAITITKAPTSATIKSAPSSVGAGVMFTLTAQVQANSLGTLPTGTVQFFDGTTPLGAPVALSNVLNGNQVVTQASATVTLASVGNHTITATYSGDNNYAGSSTAAATVAATLPFSFNAGSTTSQTIPAGGTATYNINLANPGGFTGAVNFTCTGAPGGSTCSASPNPANLTASTSSVPVTVTVTNTANASLTPSPFPTLPFVVAGLIAGLFWGMRRHKPAKTLLMALTVALVLGGVSCGGGGSSTPPPTPTPTPRPPTTATLTVTGTSGSLSTSTTLNLTITH